MRGKRLLKPDSTLTALISYSDRANAYLLEAALPLSDDQLDLGFEMGRGSLRRTLIHILAGEAVWLRRMQGDVETPWLDESRLQSVREITNELQTVAGARTTFLQRCTDADFERQMSYRDSRGGLFHTTLQEMLTQMCVHSIHHRAQAVNMLRRLGAKPPEVDYMVMVRRPAARG
ncbi:MAG: DinB family protein [Phycisphaerae bacterium]